jgi:ATP-dependent Clp protease ATP-binding subunit ClpC
MPWPERFTPDAQAAIAAAGEAMRSFRHHYLGTEHVLLGLVTHGEGPAAAALARLGVTEHSVREAIAEIVGYGDRPTPASHGVAPRLKRALERARREAGHTGHQCARSEHLLVALAAVDGVAAQILRRHGAGEPALREQIADELHDAPEVAAAIRRPPRRRLRRS